MKDLDFRKQLIINEFKTMSKGKSKEEILPLQEARHQIRGLQGRGVPQEIP